MSKIDHILSAIEKGERDILIGGIFGSAKAYLLSRIARRENASPTIIICPTEGQARELATDYELFCPSGTKTARLFPDSDVLPYLKLSPEPTNWADRIETIHELKNGLVQTVITSITAIMRVVPTANFIADSTRNVRLGDSLDRDELTHWLTEGGYADVGLVEDEGAFAVRGGLVDLWTPTLDEPVRIELDGDTVASIRTFDPSNQRSRQSIDETTIIAAGDICLSDEATENALAKIRKRAESKDFPTQERRRIQEMIKERISFPGIETLAPLFHKSSTTLFDYFPADALILIDEPEEIKHAASAYLEKIKDLSKTSTSIETLVEPEELYKPPERIMELADGFKRVSLQTTDVTQRDTGTTFQLSAQPTAEIRSLIAHHEPGEDAISPLVSQLDKWKVQKLHSIFVCRTRVQAERLVDLFKWHGAASPISSESLHDSLNAQSIRPQIVIGKLTEGFVWRDESLAIVTDEEIFGRKISTRPVKKPPMEHFTSFAELMEGDLLVHETHGIGRFTGLRHLSINDEEGDYLLMEYLGSDKLYVPVYRMNLIQRYVGAGDAEPPLDRLGGMRWSKVKKSVRKAIMAMAKDLLEVQAKREMHSGFTFPPPDSHYEEFCAAFPYDETPDQETAIDDVINDMEQSKSMDRLICGDVGYGKTEVAMRAAFKSAMAGKQVVVLVPTTILALQHYENFTERFSATPLRVEMLSRFRTSRQQKEIAAQVKRGAVDIIIGTHRLISKDIGFKDLGLIIIDEEQRFGVKHKERLKKIKETVDCIAMTATPIPRTLHLSLVGIRDISVINTPPADRLSITTHVVPFEESTIRHAIIEEINRGGQVFFVHNRVQTMPSMLRRIKQLVPEANIRMAHGQMTERELEDVMIDFIERRTNVLMCTAIIESGLDIPSANTIIVNRADTFGLAQLYQLRGRVGRSSVRAYAYLLTPPDTPLTPNAKKRLMVLKRFTELGSGFQIATHDLEIRGSGNILGAAQSGHIAQIGYELYTKLLARTIRKLSGQEVKEEIDPELKLKVEAFLPESYIEDAGTRLNCYRRMASCDTAQELDEIADEIKDRFGDLPPEASRLVGVMSVKLQAQRLGIRQITFDGRRFACQLDPSTTLDPSLAAKMAVEEPDRFKLYPPDRIIYSTQELSDPDAIIQETRKFLSTLESYANARNNAN